jgi:short chain dehydrogenase
VIRQVAVLIGTGSIGVAIGRRCATGRRLLLADYNETQLAAVAEQLRGEGYEVDTRAVDVSDQASVDALAEYATTLGTVTRLVHAAGVSPNQAPPERIIAVDLLGTVYVLEAFGRIVGEGGSGIVIASQAGHMGSFTPELEHALAYGAVEELHQLPELAEIDGSRPGLRHRQARQRAPGPSGGGVVGGPWRPDQHLESRHHLYTARPGRDDRPRVRRLPADAG